jgi:PmbA protein
LISEGLAGILLEEAKRGGASEGDVLLIERSSFATAVRFGTVDKLSHAQEKRLGLRLLVGKSSATTSTSDFSEKSLIKLVTETLDFARAAASDPYAGLPSVGCDDWKEKELHLCDQHGHEITAKEKIALACRAENAALNADPRIKNSEGSEFESSHSRVIYASTNGFYGEYETTVFRLSTTPIASDNGSMQRDSWFSENRSLALLESPEEIGKKAAARALRRLGAKKTKTQQAPVVFDPDTASSLLRSLSLACSGYSISRGASFLVGKVGTRIGSNHVTHAKNACRPRGGSAQLSARYILCKKAGAPIDRQRLPERG